MKGVFGIERVKVEEEEENNGSDGGGVLVLVLRDLVTDTKIDVSHRVHLRAKGPQ